MIIPHIISGEANNNSKIVMYIFGNHQVIKWVWWRPRSEVGIVVLFIAVVLEFGDGYG